MSKRPSFVKDEERENPITFRFPRGSSGRELAIKFKNIHELLGKSNRSETLRLCIEYMYDLHFGSRTAVFADVSGDPNEDVAIILGPVEADSLEMIERAMSQRIELTETRPTEILIEMFHDMEKANGIL